MIIKFTSVPVLDQEKALQFYTQVLGLVKMADIPLGPSRWLTVVSPEGIAGVELVLEPLNFPPSIAYQKALFEAGMPVTALVSTDIQADYERLVARGVVFRGPPQNFGMI